jgi:hypothetical protein
MTSAELQTRCCRLAEEDDLQRLRDGERSSLYWANRVNQLELELEAIESRYEDRGIALDNIKRDLQKVIDGCY